jgi:glycosyltransferase involved in cell wall biosynthesis
MEGIRVVRVWTYITANAGFGRRILDYVSFMVAAIVASPRVRDVDLIVATSPQFFSPCAAFVISRLKRVPFVFELRDFWPESIKAVGAMWDSWIIRQLERIEMFLYRQAARIVVVSPAFKTRLIDRGIEPGKIDVVTNGVDLSNFRPLGERCRSGQRAGSGGLLRGGVYRHSWHGACARDLAGGRGTPGYDA